MKQYRILEQLNREGEASFWVQELNGCWPFRSWGYMTHGEGRNFVHNGNLCLHHSLCV